MLIEEVAALDFSHDEYAESVITTGLHYFFLQHSTLEDSYFKKISNFNIQHSPMPELTPYQRLIERLMHAFIVVVLLGIFLKILVF